MKLWNTLALYPPSPDKKQIFGKRIKRERPIYVDLFSENKPLINFVPDYGSKNKILERKYPSHKSRVIIRTKVKRDMYNHLYNTDLAHSVASTRTKLKLRPYMDIVIRNAAIELKGENKITISNNGDMRAKK